MKKIFTFLTIMLVAIMTVSCGTSMQASLTNDPYEGIGIGYANDPMEAKNIAYTKAVGEIQRKSGVSVVDETQYRYDQKQNGTIVHDNSSTTHMIRTLSDGTLADVVISYKQMPNRELRRFKVAYGYEAKVKVAPENVNSRIVNE